MWADFVKVDPIYVALWESLLELADIEATEKQAKESFTKGHTQIPEPREKTKADHTSNFGEIAILALFTGKTLYIAVP